MNNTGLRPTSRAGLNPLAGFGAKPAGTRGGMGMNMGGGVPMTPGGSAAVGAALMQEVKVTDRPVTQAGLQGMKTGQSGGPVRQVADKSYFLGLVNKKTHEIAAEMTRLEGEKETIADDKVQFTKLESKYSSLIGEVRGLEGNLADYNLAMDKMRTSTDPAEITNYRLMLAERNAQDSEQSDRVLEARQELERELYSAQQQIEQVAKQAEERVDSLAPERADRFRAMQAQNAALQRELQELRQQTDMLGHQRQQMEERASGEGINGTWDQLNRAVQRAQREKVALEQERAAARLDPDEARELMLAKVKQDKQKLDEMTGELAQLSEETRRRQRTLSELTGDIEERQREEQKGGEATDKKAQSYDVLFAREKEMSAFIDAFPEKRAAAKASQLEAQEKVVALLEHISEGLSRENAMPSREQARGLRDDLQFKERQLESAEATKERLETERKKCQSELQKINTLDQKIQVELKSLTEKMGSMSQEMEQFADIPALREAAERTRQDLESKRASYKQRRDSITGQVQLLSSRYDQKKASLAENETAKTLEDLEQKLRHYEQIIYHLREVIAQKEHECNYHTIKDDCNRMLDELNSKLIKSVESQPIKAVMY